jgi:hypothetical protein
MTRRAKAAAVVGGAALAIAVFIGVDQVTPKAVEIGVTVYEDAGQHGDHLLTTGIPPSYPARSNLATVSSGLVNGCNRGLNQSSTWNDCISSATVSSLPANTKLQFWRDAGYTGGLLACYDVDGSHAIDLSGTSDLISSFRIVGGNC